MDKLVIQNGLLYDGSTKKEIDLLDNMFPDKSVIIHMVRPGEAHITVHEEDKDGN